MKGEYVKKYIVLDAINKFYQVFKDVQSGTHKGGAPAACLELQDVIRELPSIQCQACKKRTNVVGSEDQHERLHLTALSVEDVAVLFQAIKTCGITVDEAVRIIETHSGPSCWTCKDRSETKECSTCDGFSKYSKLEG